MVHPSFAVPEIPIFLHYEFSDTLRSANHIDDYNKQILPWCAHILRLPRCGLRLQNTQKEDIWLLFLFIYCVSYYITTDNMTLRRKAIDFEEHFSQLIDMLNGIYSFSSKQQQIKGMTMYQYPFYIMFYETNPQI